MNAFEDTIISRR